MQLNRNTKLFLVDPRNGDLTVMSMQSFHNYLVGSNYQAGNDFDVEVYTTHIVTGKQIGRAHV